MSKRLLINPARIGDIASISWTKQTFASRLASHTNARKAAAVNKFAAEDKRKCAEREVRMRRDVYARKVLARSRSQEQADREIAIMDEIAADYAELEKKERLI